MSYFISFIYGATVFYLHNFFPFASLFISLMLIAFLIIFRRNRSKVLPSLFFIFIAFSGFFYAKLSYVPPTTFSYISGESIEIQAVAKTEAVLLNPQKDIFSQTVEIKQALDKDMKPLHIKELRLVAGNALNPERIYRIKAHIPGDAYFLNPGSRANLLTAYADEIKDAGSVSTGLFERARIRLNGYMRDNFSKDSAGFLMSIVTGERSLLTKELREAFNATGLAHILSISGAHFGLLFFFLFRLFRFSVKLLPYDLLARLTLYVTPSQIAALLCMPAMIAYLGISDMSFPAIRSFIMIALFLLGLLVQRKGFWLNTLLLAAAVIIMIQPDSILDLSFELSFIAVLCIGLVVEKERQSPEADNASNIAVNGEVGKPNGKVFLVMGSVLKYCRASALISIAATIGTAPLVVYYFHYFSLISPITNMLITPVIGFVILPATLLSSFVFIVTGSFPFLNLIDWFTRLVLEWIAQSAQLSFAAMKIPAFPSILLIMFYLGLALYVFFMLNGRAAQDKKKRMLARPLVFSSALALLPIVTYTAMKVAESNALHITYLDVGQGDSAVVELPGKHAIVMDTGRNGFQTGEFLRYRGISTIDAVVLSHGQSDHAGGLWYLAKNFNVKEVWDNGRLMYDGLPEGVGHRSLQRGDTVEGAGFKLTALHPYKGFYTVNSDENDDSLIVKIEGRKNAFLFTGDAGIEAEENAAHLGGHLKSAVLKVPHHGSRTAASELFFHTVSPEYAVISAGKKNLYGHPHQKTLDMLGKVRIFRTDKDGAVGIRELPDGRLEIKLYKYFQLKEAKTAAEELSNVKKLFLVW